MSPETRQELDKIWESLIDIAQVLDKLKKKIYDLTEEYV